MAVQFDPSQPFEVVEEETLDSLTAPRVRPPAVAAPSVPAFDPSQPFTAVPEASAPGPVFDPNAPVQKIFSIEDFANKSVDELVADKDYQPVNFGVQNKAALLADPALQSKQEQVYRARETAGTTAMDKLRAAKKGALPGLQALYSGIAQTAKTAEKFSLAGAGTRLFNAFATEGPVEGAKTLAKDYGKSGAELAASVELASLGTVDLLRRSARELSEAPPAVRAALPAVAQAQLAAIGAKPKAEQTEGDWRNRYFNDVELAQKVEEAGRGNAEVMKLVGIDAETLKRDHDIDLDPQVISELSVVTNPVNYTPVGAVVGAVTSVGGKLVTRGLAAAKSAAQASEFAGILNKAAEAAAVTKSVGSGVTGGALKAVGGAVEATGNAAQAAIRTVLPRGAQYGVGLGSLLGGNVYKALGGLAVVKGVPKALQVGGSALKRAGAVVAGEAELPGAISLAGQTAKQATLGGLQAGVEGAIISLPFEIGARPEEEEQILGFVALGAAAGAGIRGARPGVKAAGRAAQNKLAETIFQHVEQADAPETPRYEDAPEALNNAHDANYAKLSPSDKKLVNWGRRLAPSKNLKIFTLDSAGMKAETGSATAKGYAIKIAENADGTPVVHIYLNADAQALPHEFFHALELLDPKPAKALVEAGKKALTPAQFKDFEQYYNTLRNDGLPEKFWKDRLTKDEVYREVAAEGFSRTFLAQDLSGVAPAVRQKAALFVSGLLEKLGAPLAGVNLKKGTPGASSLGVRPGTESVKLGQQWLGDILSRVNDDGTLSVTPTKAKEAPITVADVKPTPAILSAEDLDVATALRRNQVSDKAIARHFGLTEADILGALGPGKGAKPKPAAPAEAPVPVPPPQGPAVVPPEPITRPPTPIAPPMPAAPRNIRTARTAPKDSAGVRSQVTGIEEAKVAAAATGDANTVARVNELADLLNQPVEIVHSGAKAAGTVEAPSGRTVRRAEIASGGVREKYSKVTIPDRWVVVAGKPQLLASSLDKIFTNMDTLAVKAAEKGVSEKIPYPTEGGKFSEATAEQIVQDLGAYAENQRNGRKGDGTPLTRPTEEIGISIPPENPDYVPRKLTEERMNFINALMGTDPFVPRTARETKGQVPGNVKGQIIAEVNKRKPQKPLVMRPEDITKQEFKSYPGRSIAEMNPLRDELAAAGVPMRELLDANERIFAKDISQVVPRPELDFKAPVTDTIRGGFLPGEKLTAGRYWLDPTGDFKIVDYAHSDYGSEASLYRKGWIRVVAEENGNGLLVVDLNSATDRVKLNPKQKGAIEAVQSTGAQVNDAFGTFGAFLPGDTAKQISDVQAMSSDEFSAATKSWDGGLTKQAWKVGLEAATPEDVAALKAANVDAGLKARAALKEKNFTDAMPWASKSQFFREAFEAATDTGSAAGDIGWRVAFPDRQAPFPEKPVGAFQPAPMFYSELQRVIDERIKGDSIPATQLAGLVRNAGIKPDELKWSGLDDYLKGKQKVSVPELKKFLRDNAVQLEEVVKSTENEPADINVSPEDFGWQQKRAGDIRFNRTDNPDEIVWVGRHSGEDTEFIFRKATEDDGVHTEFVLDGNWGNPFSADSLDDAKATAVQYVEQNVRDRAEDLGGGDTKFQNYQVPGGLNYRELLLTLPQQKRQLSLPEYYRDRFQSRFGNRELSELGSADQEMVRSNYETVKEFPVAREEPTLFRSSHFDEPNVLAHVRFNERRDSAGKKVLFLEEVQSDWHQAGKKSGYKGPVQAENPLKQQHLERLRQIAEQVSNEKTDYAADVAPEDLAGILERNIKMRLLPEGETRPLAEEARRITTELNFIRAGEQRNASAVPDAPFKKTWPLLAVKRMIRYAAENDFDKVAWTPGDVQAARYDLSKQVKAIEVYRHPNDVFVVSADTGNESIFSREVKGLSELESLVGKDIAKKVEALPENKSKVYSGDDLKVGGEGMRGFYDQILPKEVGAYVKKWGAKVEKVQLGEEAQIEGEFQFNVRPGFDAWSVTLTPSMRSDVLTKGQKMFQPKGGVAPSISPSEITPRSPTVLPPLRPDDLEKRPTKISMTTNPF